MEFCIRLDNACPRMNLEKWNRVEHLLDQYEIKPLVGVIPDNQDPDFQAEPDHSFWEKAVQWKNKGWSIALHGLHHKLESHAPQGYYQLSHSRKTEWAGKSTSEQYQMLLKGYHILEQHGLTPTCFFAPCHTYDASTIEALKLMAAQGKEMYISDGYSLKPYKKSNICFLPSMFDTPHKLPLDGTYTFVYHPNNMSSADFDYLENFLQQYRQYFRSPDVLMKDSKLKDGQGIIGRILEYAIYFMRGLKGSKE